MRHTISLFILCLPLVDLWKASFFEIFDDSGGANIPCHGVMYRWVFPMVLEMQVSCAELGTAHWCWSGIELSEQCVPSLYRAWIKRGSLCPFDLHFGMGIWSKLVGMRRPVNALASPWLKPIEFILGNCL